MRLRTCFFTGAMAALAACGPSPQAPAQAPITVPPPSPPPPAATSPAAIDAGAPVASEATAPAAVDTTLSAPESAQLVATAPDGAALLVLHGWRTIPPDLAQKRGLDPSTRGSTEYLAVLDARHACIEETLSMDALDAAASTVPEAQALAALKAPAVERELHRAFVLARRFGLRDLGPVAFGADEGFVVVEANNALYVRSGGPGAPFTHHSIGTSANLASSPDGSRIALTNCGSPCGGMYAPAILDTKTKAVRRFPIGGAHELYWSKDDDSLVFTYDDRGPGQYESTKVCVGRLGAAAKAPSTVKCFPSGVLSTTISAASPSGKFIGLQIEPRQPPLQFGKNGRVLPSGPPSKEPPAAFVVLEMPSGTEAHRIADSLIYASIDDRGRVAWDDNRTPDFHMRVRVASRGAPEAILPNARSVGILPDGSVLVMPVDRPSDASMTEPLHTLAEKRCGYFSTWKP